MGIEPTMFITREEHQATIDRLDSADKELRKQISDVERILRTDYEGKIHLAISSVNNNLAEIKGDIKEDITEVKVHLTEQDEVLSSIKGEVAQNSLMRSIIWAIGGTGITIAVSVTVYALNNLIW